MVNGLHKSAVTEEGVKHAAELQALVDLLVSVHHANTAAASNSATGESKQQAQTKAFSGVDARTAAGVSTRKNGSSDVELRPPQVLLKELGLTSQNEDQESKSEVWGLREMSKQGQHVVQSEDTNVDGDDGQATGAERELARGTRLHGA